MNEVAQSMYFFNAVTGDIYLSEEELPPKKSHLYLVINREQLFFRMFSINSKKRVKDAGVLNIQRHFVPFKGQFLNIIYSMEKQEDKKFFFWVSPAMVDVESYFYDEVPESLIFKGDPAKVKHYHLFVFKRITGFEIIYFDGEQFYSVFEKDESQLLEKLLVLVRKFSLKGTLKVLTEVRIAGDREETGAYDLDIDLIKRDENKYFFLPGYFPVKKKFSNISRNKQVKNIKNIIRQWSRNLNIIIALLLLVVLLNAAGFVMLKKDNDDYKKKFASIQKMMDASDRMEFRFNRIKKKVASYPDHMLFMDTIAQSLGPESMLLGYTLDQGTITIEGYSPNSLDILEGLRKSNRFQEVKFKSTVTKNVYSQREKFEIEIILKPTEARP